MDVALTIIYIASFFAIFSTLVYLLTLYENRETMRKNPKPKRFPTVSIIVPAFNEQGRIKRTVDSLLNLNYPKNLLEILIVNDGSTDNTLNELNELAKKSNRIRILSKENGGKYTAMNHGLKKAKGEIIVSLDADSFVDKNALIRMIGYFNNPAVMAVTPSMKVWKPKTMLQKVQFFEYMFGIFLRKAASYLGCIHVTPGPFSAYRKWFFDKYGLYKHAHDTEDIEIAMRIQSKNYLIENCPDAYSYTLAPSKFKPLFKQRIRWYVGFISNVWDYKRFFSRKYGALGLFFIPSAFLSVFFTIFLIGYSIKTMSQGLFNGIFNLWSINFDFTKLLKFKIDTFYLAPGIITILAILSILFVTSILYLAKTLSHDKEKIAVPFVLALIFYAPLYAIWWLASFSYKLTGKTTRWAGDVWEKD